MSQRRETLLKEMHRRSKVGGIRDRRFGENDPSMTPEQRAAERYAQEVQRKSRNLSMFDLEDDEGSLGLTHGGRSLVFDEQDDYQDDDSVGSNVGEDMESGLHNRKRRRLSDTDGDTPREDVQPDRKKTKDEVMKEVIAKSKLHKYERQQAKEDDDDLRAELDKDLSSLFPLLNNNRTTQSARPSHADAAIGQINPDRAALLEGKDRAEADREYDERLRQMIFDKRSKPAERTKTEEEKAAEEAERLRTLEHERLRRMQGDDASDSEDGADIIAEDMEEAPDHDDAELFGLQQADTSRLELGPEDEDDFLIEDDLIASASDVELTEDESEADTANGSAEDDDDEFIDGLTLPEVSSSNNALSGSQSNARDQGNGLSYTYPFPQTRGELSAIVSDLPYEEIPIVVQRIRALYSPKLSGENKMKMETFSSVLTQFVTYIANQAERPPFEVLETLLRHIHSIAKSFPQSVASAFRAHLREVCNERPLSLLPGDLVLLTGIATIFPTSDHFHPVVTLASMVITRYLGQADITSLADSATGLYLSSLFVQYQKLSSRFVPELLGYVNTSIYLLAPVRPDDMSKLVPTRHMSMKFDAMSLKSSVSAPVSFWDTVPGNVDSTPLSDLRVRVLGGFIAVADSASSLWSTKSAFNEIFEPVCSALSYVLNRQNSTQLPTWLRGSASRTLQKLQILSQQSIHGRQPLQLHRHRPLAIKMSIPKFEESFNPDKHYDPDRERSEINKLKAEHKRERKGAMRELRKDANFIARESLREKKEKDSAYEKKYKKLIASIQSEEGRESNAYEREKRARKAR